MSFTHFVEVPLLWAAFLIFLISLLSRIIFSITAGIIERKKKDNSSMGALLLLFRSLLPFYMNFINKPIYSILRYIFHICLFIVPIWLTGHVMLWSTSRFGWQWRTLPDKVADWMTIGVLCFVGCFLLKKIISAEARHDSSPSDYILLIITAAPFLTGYLLTHGTPAALDFLSNQIWIIHILSGEVMLVVIAILFSKIRLKREKCTGCSTCVLNCPAGALSSHDQERRRFIYYSFSQCVHCGNCVRVCPELAVDLRHMMSLPNFARFFERDKIQDVELSECEGCGALFAPEPLLNRVAKSHLDDYRHYCPACKKDQLAVDFYKVATWPYNFQTKQ